MRGRPSSIIRPTKLTLHVAEDVRAKLDLHLFSHLEGRVPHGAYSKFLAERINEYFDPLSPQQKLERIKLFITQAETDGWTPEQVTAIEAFREAILEKF